MPEEEKKPELEKVTIQVRRDFMIRMRMLREYAEEKAKRPYPMSELFEVALNDFLNGIDDGK